MSSDPWVNGRPVDEPEPEWSGIDYAVAAGDPDIAAEQGPDPAEMAAEQAERDRAALERAERAERPSLRVVDAPPTPTTAQALLDLEAEEAHAAPPLPSSGKPSQAGELVDLALGRYRLGQGMDGEPFAVPLDGPRIVRILRGGRASLRAELAAAYRRTRGRVPSAPALSDCMTVLEGMALGAPREALALRVGRDADGVLWLDLGDPTGRAVRVDGGRWAVVDAPGILFRRSELTGALPEPVLGSLDGFLALLHVEPDDRPLLVAWLVAALLGVPVPICYLRGPAGAGKTSAARVMARLIDPSPAQLRAVPRDLEGWAVAAAGAYVVALDNLTHISDWFSDALCRAVTGEAVVRRALYTDAGLSVVAFRRPIILTAIDAGALRGDLADRLLTADLAPISERDRRDDASLEARWTLLWGEALGGLLTVTSAVMGSLSAVRLARLPRMADFGRVLAAVDALLGSDGLPRYLAQRGELQREAAEGDRVGAAVLAWMAERPEWQGTPAQLLEALTPEHPPRDWPATPRALSGALRRVAQPLAAAGIVADFGRTANSGSRRFVHLSREDVYPTVATVATVAASVDGSDGRGDAATVATVGSDGGDGLWAAPERGSDGSDGSDGTLQPFSVASSIEDDSPASAWEVDR